MMVYTCDNCQHEEFDPPIARDLHERLDDGGRATTRECSRCGSLTYLSRNPGARRVMLTATMLATLEQALSDYETWLAEDARDGVDYEPGEIAAELLDIEDVRKALS